SCSKRLRNGEHREDNEVAAAEHRQGQCQIEKGRACIQTCKIISLGQPLHKPYGMDLRPVRASSTRIGPRNPRLGRAIFQFMLPLLQRVYVRHRIYRLNTSFAAERLRAVRAELERGATVYLAGISPGGQHNSGIALVEASRERGIQLICNHEEERF